MVKRGGHTNERPTGPVPKGKHFQKTSGPPQAHGHKGPDGSKGTAKGGLVNTLAARRMNGIGAVRTNHKVAR